MNHGRMVRVIVALGAVIAVTGCSSIVNEKTASISVDSPGCPAGTECTLKHKKGEYRVRTPGHVTVQKSDDPLQIDCRSPDGRAYVNAAESKMGSMIWGNIIFGGGVGAIVDAHTDAHRIYPHTIKVPMCIPGRENEAPDVTFPDSRQEGSSKSEDS